MESVKCLKKRGVIAVVPKLEAVGMYRPRLEDLALEDGFNFEVGKSQFLTLAQVLKFLIRLDTTFLNLLVYSKQVNQFYHFSPRMQSKYTSKPMPDEIAFENPYRNTKIEKCLFDLENIHFRTFLLVL